ncbi:hypothetical protein [Flavobacterium sp.]|uniref:hypothetical protein n=1 Tax=Flavobacterium sp. TaxID=239 RepID=UPI004048D436
MAGEGFMLSANTSLKNNKRSKKSRLEKFVNTTSNGQSELIDHKTETPEMLAEIREKLQTENKLQLRKKIIKTLIFIAIIIIVFTFLNRYFSKNILY